MTDLRTDDIDKKLINLLQVDFPLSAEPFSAMGQRLGISEDEVIKRIQQLKTKGIVRLIGPVMEARKLGYQTTLIAMSVPAEKLKKAEKNIASHPSISHAYEREHRLNLWATFAAPARADIDSEIADLAAAVESTEYFSLPALKLFKIGAYFGMGNDGDDIEDTLPGPRAGALPGRVSLTAQDKVVLNVLQQDLPLEHRPFSCMAEDAGLKVDAFLGSCASLLERGVLRRYSASINHRNAGYGANAMVCWQAPSSVVEKAGNEMAKIKQVSHCYERRTNALWPYNLYSMLHARSRDICNGLIDELSLRTGLNEYLVLFSTREFKKTRIKYTA
jgi:siroheme decarboxylase